MQTISKGEVLNLRKSWFLLIVVVSAITLLAACGGESGGGGSSGNPVTLKIAGHPGSIPEENFSRFIADPVKKKYPHITLERVDTSQQGMYFTDLITAGDIPDIVYDYPYVLTEFNRMGLSYNMEELIKKHKFDLNSIQPEFLTSIKEVSSLDYLPGLPMFNNAFALFYNQDLFDRFGIDPPTDNMTWQEVRNLALRITRTDDQVLYRGLWPDFVYRGAYQAELSFADFQNHKPVFQSSEWQELFKLWYDLWDIGAPIEAGLNYVEEFKQGRVAMISGYTGNIFEMLKVEGLNWDVVTYPINPKAPGVGQRVDSVILSITEQSKNKDEAFQVIATVLSKDVQTAMSKQAMMSVLKDDSVHAQFGKDTPELADKNVVAFTKLKLATLKSFGYVPTGTAVGIPINAFIEVLQGKDINTALREADELMRIALEEEAVKAGIK